MYPGVPILPIRAAVLVAVGNLLLPGSGTAYAGWRGGLPALAWKGVWQLAAAVVLVGWVWALVTSAKLLANAREVRGFRRLAVAEPGAVEPPTP